MAVEGPPAERGAATPAVVRVLGIWREVELVQDEEEGEHPQQHIHFAGEVLVADHSERFPWQLMDPCEWATAQEAWEFWPYFH